MRPSIIIEVFEAAVTLIKESNYSTPLLGFEFRNAGYGASVKCLPLSFRDLSYKAIDDFLFKDSGSSYSFSNVVLLENEEWSISDYGFDVLNTWGKLLKIINENNITENGQYVVVNRSKNTATEIKLYNTHPWIKRSTLTISGDSKAILKEIGECGKATDLEIIFIPDFHMWKVNSWETYPDDPGCGIYSISVDVFDKATGVQLKKD